MESAVKLHIDTIPYQRKPENEYGIIKPRLQKTSPQAVSIYELTEKIGKGFTVSPGVMNGGISAANWQEQRLFMVDIDNETTNEPLLTINQALEICKVNNILPAFYYYTFSHTEQKPKFRLCFICKEVITDTNIRAAIIESLISLFPQSDKACLNADRMFLGCNQEHIICDENAVFSIESALSAYISAPSKTMTVSHNSGFKNDDDLERLKRDFDFFDYLQRRNGATKFNNQKSAMFESCELCGGHDDLVFYHATNSFKCFSSKCGKGGSIIDYLMIVDNLDVGQAIDKFKYELCGLERPQFTREQRQDFAIKKILPGNTELIEHLKQLQPHLNYQLNDKGMGELFADVYKNLCRFNVTAKEWYVFDGKIWAEDIGAMQVSRFAKELTDALLVYSTAIEDEDKKKSFIEYIAKLNAYRNRKIMIEDSKDKYFISRESLDKDLHLFNCQNGTLNLKNFEFKPHSPNDLLSKISNVTYVESAISPQFEKFINDVMQGNVQKIDYLQKLLGYSLTGDTKLEACFILYGATTRNGKSTLVETYAYMLGNTVGYALNMKPETLAAKQNTDSRQASGDIARLDGCRFLNASEPPKKMIFDVGLLKNLLGRDSITCRHLHEREFEFMPRFKLFMNTNFLPLISDDTLFTSGRINVITFDRHFEPHEQDRDLKDKLKKQDNISGFFNWCIKGLKLFYEYGADPPHSVKSATGDYRANSDKVGNFISECLEPDTNNIKALDVYKAYQTWCKNNGFGAENKSNFFAELKSKNIFAKSGTVKGKTNPNIVIGYKIIEEIIDFPEPPLEKYQNSYNYFD